MLLLLGILGKEKGESEQTVLFALASSRAGQSFAEGIMSPLLQEEILDNLANRMELPRSICNNRFNLVRLP